MQSIKPFLLVCTLVFAAMNGSMAQSGISPTSGYVDPAMNHNRLIMEKTGDGYYKMVGTFKVIGTSYLFGEHNEGNLFSTDAKAYNIYLSYNTYNQEVEFFTTNNPDKPLVKTPGTLDSFVIKKNPDNDLFADIKFDYATTIGATDKSYYQEVYIGKRFSLYKRYKSELGYVSSNYVQSELREFDLSYDYFYTDTNKKGAKKLKQNASSVISEFKEVKDLSTVVDGDSFSANPEAVLRKAFESLNN